MARHLGKVCLVGCSELQIDEAARSIKAGDPSLQEDELITLDGNEGLFYAGAAKIETVYPEELLAHLDALRRREQEGQPTPTHTVR